MLRAHKMPIDNVNYTLVTAATKCYLEEQVPLYVNRFYYGESLIDKVNNSVKTN